MTLNIHVHPPVNVPRICDLQSQLEFDKSGSKEFACKWHRRYVLFETKPGTQISSSMICQYRSLWWNISTLVFFEVHTKILYIKTWSHSLTPLSSLFVYVVVVPCWQSLCIYKHPLHHVYNGTPFIIGFFYMKLSSLVNITYIRLIIEVISSCMQPL